VDLFREFIAREVDGVFFAPLEGSPEAAARESAGDEALVGSGYSRGPDRQGLSALPHRSNAPLIGIDNFRAGYPVAGIICPRKQRGSISYGSVRSLYRQYEDQGYQAALSDAGIIASSAWVHIGDPEDKDFAKTILDSGAQNLICGNDETAALLMNTFRDMNVDIPSEVRLAAFDDVKYGRFISVPLTTVHQPIEEIARRAVLEMERCRTESKGIPGNTVFLHSDLIIRKSSLITR
jgi:DNA-binding LacI/PurR family transcriptional regulator